MGNVKFTTLAAVRKLNPAAFDLGIKQCVHEAAQQVGMEVVIRALCMRDDSSEMQKAA